MLLLLTGCTCEYNLTIDNNVYKEEINLTGENNEETSNINNKWKVPVDKDEYNKGGDPESNSYISGDIYEYKVTGNILKFNYDFTKSTYPNSSAVSNCYDKLTVLNYENSTVISTSSKATCFDEYPLLTSITVNIKVDKPVKNYVASETLEVTLYDLEYKEAIKPGCEMQIKHRVVYLAIAKAEKIKVSAKDYKDELKVIANEIKGTVEEAQARYSKEALTPYLQIKKVSELVKSTAIVK